MRITNAEDYALRMVLYLAGQPEGCYSCIGAIAREQGIPVPYLRKLVKPLTRAGLLVSRRGADGGVALARPARRISFREVIEALDGPIVLQGCLAPEPAREEPCEIAGRCQMREAWRWIQARFLESLETIHVGDLVAPPIPLETATAGAQAPDGPAGAGLPHGGPGEAAPHVERAGSAWTVDARGRRTAERTEPR